MNTILAVLVRLIVCRVIYSVVIAFVMVTNLLFVDLVSHLFPLQERISLSFIPAYALHPHTNWSTLWTPIQHCNAEQRTNVRSALWTL